MPLATESERDEKGNDRVRDRSNLDLLQFAILLSFHENNFPPQSRDLLNWKWVLSGELRVASEIFFIFCCKILFHFNFLTSVCLQLMSKQIKRENIAAQMTRL